MKKTTINLDERIGMHVRMSVRRYMYVARLARLSRHGSRQRILDDFFPAHWEREGETLQERTRKLGYKDFEFYPPKILKRMGIKPPKPGRQGKRSVA